MGRSEHWSQRFAISGKELVQANFELNSTAGLAWCLMHGRIPEPEYLDWAMTQYNLPSITGDYFAAPPDEVFWSRFKDLYPWSPTLIPVAEWQGTLMIACLEPPIDFKLKIPHQFVLASVRNLFLLWNQHSPPTNSQPNPESQTPTTSSIKFELPENLVTAGGAETATGKPEVGPEGFVLQSNVPAIEKLAPKPAELIDLAPEGFSLNPQVSEAAAAAPAAQAPAAHKGFVFRPPAPPARAQEKPVKPAQTPPPLPAEIEPADEEEQMMSDDTGIRYDGALFATAESHHVHRLHEVEEEPEADLPSPDPEKGDTFLESSDNTLFGQASVSERTLNSATTIDDLGAVTLANILKLFEGGMILIFKDGEILPWKWTDLLTGSANASLNALSLATPSIFRIVATTQLPYHGRVAKSAINDRFFQAFFKGEYPAHVTVVPALYEKQLVGMLLGIARAPVAYIGVLSQLQQLADEASVSMINFDRSSAASSHPA